MSDTATQGEGLRAQILENSDAILGDPDVMRALVSA